MKVSTKAFDAINIKYSEYEEYCKKREENPNKLEVRKQFFRDYLDGRIVREQGILVRKKIRKGE